VGAMFVPIAHKWRGRESPSGVTCKTMQGREQASFFNCLALVIKERDATPVLGPKRTCQARAWMSSGDLSSAGSSLSCVFGRFGRPHWVCYGACAVE
jgi:hypothetical protein